LYRPFLKEPKIVLGDVLSILVELYLPFQFTLSSFRNNPTNIPKI